MTRVLVESFRDEDKRKYKLYSDDEQWTVVSDAQLFAGSRENATAFLKSRGMEPVEAVEAISEGINTTAPEEAKNVKEPEGGLSGGVDVDAGIIPETYLETETIEEGIIEHVVENASSKEVTEIIDEAEAEPEPSVTIAVEVDTTDASEALDDLDARIEALKAKRAELEK